MNVEWKFLQTASVNTTFVLNQVLTSVYTLVTVVFVGNLVYVEIVLTL